MQTLLLPPSLSETYIEKNIFDNYGGVIVSSGSNKIYIRNNVFSDVIRSNSSSLSVSSNSNPSNLIITNNSFLTYDTEHPAMRCNNGSDVIASNNFWNTTDTNIIDLMITDRNDNLNIDNYILYIPFLTEPDTNTPIFLPNQILNIQSIPSDANTLTPSVGEYTVSGFVDISADKYINCPDVYLFDHWDGDVADPNSSNTTVFMDADKTITAVFTATRECGDECHPDDLFGDYNNDCIINITDFSQFALNWLVCTKPECDL